MEASQDYLVYRDAQTDRVTVLMRRSDGHFDLHRKLVAKREPASGQTSRPQARPAGAELVVITGLSGSGKATVLKAFEDLGYYAVDNLPIELIPKFAELAKDSAHVRRAALVIDIREGEQLAQFPGSVRETAAAHSGHAAVSRSRRQHAGAPIQRDPASASAGHRGHGAQEPAQRSASCWRPFAAWPITSSTPRSSTCTSCAK